MHTYDDPWRAREEDFPHEAPVRDQLRFLLNFAVLAPSIYNTQPWVFRISGDEIELYADRSRMLREADSRGRQLIASCGSALMNLRIAIAYYGFQPIVKTFPQMDVADLLASVKLGAPRPRSEKVDLLFDAIRKQAEAGAVRNGTSKIPGTSISKLREAAAAEGAILDVVDAPDARNLLLSLIRNADRMLHGQAVGSELETGFSGDGVAAPDVPTVHGLSWGETRRPTAADRIEHPSVLTVLSTRSDNPFEWLAAGQALARLVLVARGLDLQTTFFNQPVEVDTCRSRLVSMLGPDRVPQLIIRLEPGDRAARVPRRPLHDVLASF